MNEIPQKADFRLPVLVTGAAGLIGSSIIWRLNQMGVTDIVACDRMSEDKWRNLVPLKFTDYIEADDLLKEMTPGNPNNRLGTFGAVFHMGAESATDTIDCRKVYDWNYDFSVKLLMWSRLRGYRLIYASSAATYGNDALDVGDDLKGLQALRPTSLYGWFKHRFDLYVDSYGWNNVAGLKFFNVYGGNEYHKRQKSMVFRAPMDLANGKFGVFNSDGLARDFINSKAAADAAIHLAQTGHPGIFNVGTGEMVTWKDLAVRVVTAMKRDPAEITTIEFPKALRGFSGYQQQTRADITKLKNTGWAPRNTLDDGIADCLKYALSGLRLGEEDKAPVVRT